MGTGHRSSGSKGARELPTIDRWMERNNKRNHGIHSSGTRPAIRNGGKNQRVEIPGLDRGRKEGCSAIQNWATEAQGYISVKFEAVGDDTTKEAYIHREKHLGKDTQLPRDAQGQSGHAEGEDKPRTFEIVDLRDEEMRREVGLAAGVDGTVLAMARLEGWAVGEINEGDYYCTTKSTAPTQAGDRHWEYIRVHLEDIAWEEQRKPAKQSQPEKKPQEKKCTRETSEEEEDNGQEAKEKATSTRQWSESENMSLGEGARHMDNDKDGDTPEPRSDTTRERESRSDEASSHEKSEDEEEEEDSDRPKGLIVGGTYKPFDHFGGFVTMGTAVRDGLTVESIGGLAEWRKISSTK